MRNQTFVISVTPGLAESIPCYRAEGVGGVGEGKRLREEDGREVGKTHGSEPVH